ncbi:MAG: hypothetical protein GY817_02795 [bacterium]|nr:hypothetical protein [bacterium]
MKKNENEIDLSLTRVKQAMAGISNFSYQKLKVIHVAGTNGKGSVCAFLSSIFTAQGFKTGLYTSPHLERITERIKINNQEILAQDLDAYLKLFDAYDLTYFEHLTVAAMKYFYDKKVDYLILETGLGGRLDATNIFDKPFVTVLTSIGLDHTEYLGDTLAEVLAEKMGILKRKVPLVSGFTHPDLIKKTQELEIPILELSDYKFNLRMFGSHQELNANISYTVARKFLVWSEDSSIRNDARAQIAFKDLRDAIETTILPARLELIDNFLFDVSHNEAGIEGCLQFLVTLPPNLQKNRVLVLGLLKDKRYKKIIAQLLPYFEEIYLTEPASERALNLDILTEEITLQGGAKKVKMVDLSYSKIINEMKKKDRLCCVIGSFYLVAGMRKLYLRQKHG